MSATSGLDLVAPPNAAIELRRLREQVAALEQLLEVHEETAMQQAGRLERTLRERSEALTLERATSDRLIASEQRLRLALDAGRMGTWEWDIVGNRVYWSPEEERLYGLVPGTYSGTVEDYAARIHPDDRASSFALLQEALARSAPTHHVVHRILRADGAVRWLDSHGRFVYGSDGKPLRLVGVSTDVTEQREIAAARDQALAQARAERERLTEVFAQAPAAIAVLDGREHRFTVANALYLQLVGGRDLRGRAVREALPELEGQGFFELIDQVYDSGEPFVANEALVHLDRDRDGVAEPLYVDFVYQPLKQPSGETFAIMVHAIEVTERVQSRQRIEALAAERSAILGQIVDVVVTTDPRGNINFSNDASRAIYGEMRHGVPIWDESQPFTLLNVDGSARDIDSIPLRSAVRGERVTNQEWRVRRGDGQEFIVTGSAVPLRAGDGTLIGAAMTVRDITEQRALQKQVEFERARLREMLQQAPAAISVTEGAEHVIVMQNEVARQLVGGRDLVGMKARDLFPEIEAQGFVALQDEVYRTGEPFVGREMPVRFDPQRTGTMMEAYFNFVYHPLRDVNGKVYGILSHAVDVTDQVRARQMVEERAEELTRLSRELERSNKELDQFAYVASHDLKAPLRGIGNLAQWIKEDLGDRLTEESARHIELLQGRVNRMEALIEGILTYSRAGRVREKSESVDVHALVQEVIELVAPPANARVVITGPLPTLETQRVPLQQVFMNFIANAIKYNDKPEPVVTITARDRGEFVEFSVADNGPGIPPQFQDRIWQIFQTLAPRDTVEGTGIGLSVVRKLVEARGGTTWLDSDAGRGATFFFTWPMRPGMAE